QIVQRSPAVRFIEQFSCDHYGSAGGPSRHVGEGISSIIAAWKANTPVSAKPQASNRKLAACIGAGPDRPEWDAAAREERLRKTLATKDAEGDTSRSTPFDQHQSKEARVIAALYEKRK